jgi:hypothetical protein
MDDLAPFESPKILIEGVKERLVDIDEASKRFLNECDRKIITYTDPNTKESVAKVCFGQRIPGRIREMVSNCINNLRHSLDQAVCDGAVLLGRPNSKGVYFPFGKTPKNLDDEFGSRCKNVDPDFVKFIRRYNCHYGGNDELYAFGSLAGANKHQRIIGIALDSGSQSFGGKNAFVRGPASFGYFKWSDARNELEFARTQPGGYIQGDYSFAFYIGIDTGKAVFPGSAPTVLSYFASKFEGIVLGLEAETARILRARTP